MKLTEKLLDEILLSFINGGEENPSADLMTALAAAAEITAKALYEHYRLLYQEATGRDDDPYDPAPMQHLGS